MVTGGAGYVGAKLVARLLECGHRVTILDKFYFGYDAILHLSHHRGLDVHNGDIREFPPEAIRQFDYIYHLAGLSGYAACEANPHSARSINVEGTAKLVDAMRDEQVLVYASTTSFYGRSGTICDEKSEITATSLYGHTKHEGELFVREFPSAVVLRFATIFGVSTRMRTDLLVNDFVYKAVNDRALVLFDSQSRRTFLHIDDAVKAYLMVISLAEQMRGGVFNVGAEDMNFSKREIADAVSKFVDFEIIESDVPDFDKRDFIISFQKLSQLGFTRERDLASGIEELVRLYTYYKPHITYRPV